ncbi:cache domain-containing protein [Thiomicrorhabdus aquaedulcis]|uniref:cache domain-containing protein n=1 Tax=Thiomicrorhabdus aquaedulcis TaxID=2211106 RepID=UPI000FD72024|nr:cache domain-containing protein [Thiomicrorhabdus aquaedulcis]
MIKAITHNLSVRILLIAVAFTVVFLVLLLGLVSQLFLQESKTRFMLEKTALIEAVSHLIDDSLKMRTESLTQFAAMLHNGQQLKPKETVQAMLDDRVLLHQFFNGGLLLLDSEAVGMVDSPIVPNRVGTHYHDREHVQWVKMYLKPYTSSPFMGRRLKTPIFIVNVPVLSDQNKLLGYMIGISILKEDHLLTQLAQRFLNHQSQFFVLDLKNKMFINSTDKGFVFQAMGERMSSPLLQKLEQGEHHGEAVGFDGVPLFFNAQKLKNVDWWVVSGTHREQVLEPTRTMLLNVLIVGGVLFF